MEPDSLSNPMKVTEADFKSGNNVYHLDSQRNEIDEWCVGNTAIKVDGIGRVVPIKIKGQQHKRIDGAVTKIIANAILGRYRSEFLEMVG